MMGAKPPRKTSAQVMAEGAAKRQELAQRSAAAKQRYADASAKVQANKAARNPMSAPTASSAAGSARPSGSMMDRIKASGAARFKKGGMAKSGSSASKRADGIAHKGKTKGKMVKMAYGGKC